jgi:DnaJ family protein C protein 7
MMMGDQTVTVQPLSTAQPLAHRVLQRIQVSCPLQGVDCSWKGDYGDLQHHLLSKTAHVTNEGTEQHAAKTASSTEPMQVDGEQQQAQQHVEAATRRVTVAKSFKEEANTQFAARHYGASRDLYTKALDILTTTPVNDSSEETGRLMATLFANRAASHLACSDYAHAKDDAFSAMQADPVYAKAYVRAARALVQLGDFRRATQVLEQGLQHVADSVVLQKELESAAGMQAQFDLAQELLVKSDFASAKAIWGRLLGETGAANVVLGLARADLGLGLTDSTLKLTRQVLKKDPHSADAFTVRGHCQVLMGEGDSGIKLMKEAMRLDPDSSTTRIVYKECAKMQALWKEATNCMFHRKFQQAIQLLTEAVAAMSFLPPKAPLYGSLYTARAKAYLRMKQYASALKDCALVVYHREDDVDAWLVRFSALHGLERHQEVLEEVSALMNKWGSNESRIRGAYDKADFEVRKQKRPDFYKMLSLTPIASEREIKKAYRQASLACHPDRLIGNDYTGAQRKTAQHQFQLLGEGLEILTDDFKRQLYDEGYDPEAIKERVEAAQHAAHRNGDHYHGHGHGHGPH